MAHKKGLGSTQNTHDTAGKRLGVKLFGGEKAWPGCIIVRQRGTKHHPGRGVGIGKDHTIFAKREGVVQFKKQKKRSYVSVVPEEQVKSNGTG